jgi:hypothetical protein
MRELRRAWHLYRSDSRAETVAAAVLLGAVAVPVLRALWEVKTRRGRG